MSLGYTAIIESPGNTDHLSDSTGALLTLYSFSVIRL